MLTYPNQLGYSSFLFTVIQEQKQGIFQAALNSPRVQVSTLTPHGKESLHLGQAFSITGSLHSVSGSLHLHGKSLSRLGLAANKFRVASYLMVCPPLSLGQLIHPSGNPQQLQTALNRARETMQKFGQGVSIHGKPYIGLGQSWAGSWKV